MAVPGIRYDDGTNGFATNCFPVRSMIYQGENVSGAWLSEERAEQRRRFKAVLCTKPRTFDEIREVRKISDKEGTGIQIQLPQDEDLVDEEKVLDGFFLMKHCCVEDPSDLCSVNISGQGLTDVKEDDFLLFDNVAYVNAAENILPLEAFDQFTILRELDLSLNGLRSFKLTYTDFQHLEMLDVSYNNLSHDDILSLGLLPNLIILHLSGNNFKSLPLDMAKPLTDVANKIRVPRFPKLEMLALDDNNLQDLNTFAALAGLRRLKHLNLSKNKIFSVPQLLLMENKHTADELEYYESREETQGDSRMSSKHGSPRKSKRNTPRSARSQQSTSRKKSSRKGRGSASARVIELNEANSPEPTAAESKSKEHEKQPTNTKESGTNVPGVESLMGLEDFAPMEELEISKSVRDLLDEGMAEVLPTMLDDSKGPPPPFPELEHLDLSYNEQEDKTPQPKLSPCKICNKDTHHTFTPTPLKSEVDLQDLIDPILGPVTGKIFPDIKTNTPTSKFLNKTFCGDNVLNTSPKRNRPGPPLSLPEKWLHFEEFYTDHPMLPPPFSELRRVDLSYNKIQEEESLLAVAAWPMVSEILIHNNPLTRETAGDPPLLKRFLTDRLGIRIVRIKPGPKPKPPVDMPQKKSRRVKTYVPKVPKKNIDELLALEYPKPAPPSREKQSPVPTNGEGSPLPPIPATPGTIERENSQIEDQENQKPPAASFFMTQGEEQPSNNANQNQGESENSKTEVRKKKKHKKEKVDEKYKGYELLLSTSSRDTKSPDDLPLPKDIVGNIKALQYTLDHPIVYKDNKVEVTKVSKPFVPYVRPQHLPKSNPKSKCDKIDDALKNLKNRTTVIEAELREVISNKQKFKKDFPEAQKLLGEVQRRYNTVRENSMKEAKHRHKLLTEASGDIAMLTTNKTNEQM